MAIKYRLPFTPPDAIEINETLSYLESGNQATYFAAGVPLFVHDKDDAMGRRLASMQVLELKLAKKKELSEAFGIDRVTLYRQQIRLRENGIAGLLSERRGPKGGHKLTQDDLPKAQELMESGATQAAVGEALGVSVWTIRRALSSGKIVRPRPLKVREEVDGSQPSERSAEAASTPMGVGTQRYPERILAAAGKLVEAQPEFQTSLAVEYGGALLALPALMELGLLEVAQKVYGSVRKGFYGLRSMLLCLAFMALLRIRTPEQMQFEAPGELGILLGLDRAPEIKTIRRKLKELSERKRADRFSRGLAEKWVKRSHEEAGLFYVDGHVRAYHGEKHKLSKTYVARRRLCMPATTDYWVNDKNAEPVFFVTGTANERLIAMMRKRILPEVRGLVGERRVTMVFDREGWSPKFFEELYEKGFDVMTYRKGKYRMWPRRLFKVVRGFIDGRKVKYELAEKKAVRMSPGFTMREVRRLRGNGRQTAVLTTRKKMSKLQVAWRMFERWRQENFLRYMREHFALDALVDRRAEQADAERTVPNPKRTALKKRLKELRNGLHKLEKEYGERALLENTRGFKVADEKLRLRIRELQEKRMRLKKRIRALPERVSVKEAGGKEPVMQLDPETKHLTDTIKMVAYRAESVLFGLLGPAYKRNEDEGRALVREMLRVPADILPDAQAGVLRVRLHSLANPRSNGALAHLCEQLNQAQIRYPETRLRLRYEPIFVAENLAICLET